MKFIWKGRKLSVRVFRFITASVLILCMMMTGAFREYGPIVAEAIEDAQEDDVLYVSNIRLFYALDSMENAVNKCKEAGYIPVEKDLNAGTEKNYVVMGYQTTEDEEDAITSIKMLAMDSGYELKDYAELQKEYENSNSSVIDTIEAASLEFEANYKSGSPKAKQAYEGLNLIEVPEAGGMKLGEYIVQGKADWDFYAKVVTRASSGTVNAIFGYLSTGIANYENEYDSKERKMVSVSWAAKVKDSPVWDDLDEAVTEDDYDKLYTQYGDDARNFHKKLQEFATAYETVQASYDEGELVDELTASCEGKSDEDILDEKKSVTENEQGMIYISIYDALNEFQANDDYDLGEYLLELGLKTSDEVDLTKLYPVIESMSYAQRGVATMNGLVSLVSTASENEADSEAEEKIEESAKHIKDIVGRESYSIWLGGTAEIKDKKVAYTSDAIRMNASQQILDAYDNTSWKEKAEDIMKWVNLALGIVSCVLILAKFSAVAYALAAIPAGICAIAAACGMTCAATTIGAIAGKIAAGASVAGGPVGWIVLAVMIVAIIVIWVVSLIQKHNKENADIDYTDAPDYVADRAEVSGGYYLTYYKGAGSEDAAVIGDYAGSEAFSSYHGNPGISDVNGRMGFRGWNCMFYSKDKNVGSPIVVRDGKEPFDVVFGGGDLKNGYDCVKTFGEITPANLNSLMKSDKVGGIFMYYRTVKSVKNDSGATENQGTTSDSDDESDGSEGESATGEKLYYADIIVKSADDPDRAKAKIKTKGYNIWDFNLGSDARKNYSRKGEWAYTYLGYKVTTDPKLAIRDIRVATFYPSTQQEMVFGEVKYGCAGNLGYKAESTSEDKDYPSDLDGLWFTTDTKAGTPIEVGKLHMVHSHEDGEYVNQGWVPVTTFGGVPYNFASTRDSDTDDWEPGRMGNYGYRYTCYCTKKDNKWENVSNYIYYEPEVKYTSGTQYLSSVFFVFGTDSEEDAAKVGETEAKVSQLVDKMQESPNTVVDTGTNLAKSFYYKGYVIESNQKYLYIGYTWSYNPYRALTDIKVYQGTTYSSELPYNVKKATEYSAGYAATASKNMAYAAATVVSQRTGTKCKWVIRGIGPENAYIAPNGLLGTNMEVPKGYTSYQPGGYDYGEKKSPFTTTGLYVSGPSEDAEKLTLNDIIISGTAHQATDDGGVITADVTGETTLAGEAAEGDFNSIQEMKNPYELEPYNLSYPEWTNDSGDHYDAGSPRYIYIRKTALKKKYISKLFVGSYSFADSKQKESESANYQVAKIVDQNAMTQANAQATDEVIPANIAVNKGRTWYGTSWGSTVKDGSFYIFDEAKGWYSKKSVPAESTHSIAFGPPGRENVKDGSHNYRDSSGGRDIHYEYVDRPAAYVSVARTDDPNEAIKGVLLYKLDADTAPERIQVDGVEYYCASTSMPIRMSSATKSYEYNDWNPTWIKQNYFLYYTVNKGVAPGQPITEINIDEIPLATGQATALCVDTKDKVSTSKDGRKTVTERAIPYGEVEMAQYIHASYEKSSNMYFNKIYTASGSSRRAALLQLAEQGCTEFCDMNLNEEASLTKADTDKDSKKKGGEYVYFGYRGFTINEKAIAEATTADAKAKALDEQLQDAVYDIVCTIGEDYHPEGIMTEKYQIYYTPVTKLNADGDTVGTDLNAGTNGPAIYMYYTTPWVTEQYNAKTGTDVRKNLSTAPKDYLKSPLVKLCFTRYDRVPYTTDSGTVSTGDDDVRPWEYVMYSDYSAPVDFNDGTVKLDSDKHTENNHITMFAQREDGSVKTAAEITGGYTTATTEVGEMWLNR